MHLVLESKKYEVRIYASLRDDFSLEVPVLAFLHANSKQYSGSVSGFKSQFSRYAEHGRAGLTVEMLHEVDKQSGIWEFVKGDLRVFCFFDGGRVVLTHGSIKKTQKVDRQHVDRALAAKNKYFKNNER